MYTGCFTRVSYQECCSTFQECHGKSVLPRVSHQECLPRASQKSITQRVSPQECHTKSVCLRSQESDSKSVMPRLSFLSFSPSVLQVCHTVIPRHCSEECHLKLLRRGKMEPIFSNLLDFKLVSKTRQSTVFYLPIEYRPIKHKTSWHLQCGLHKSVPTRKSYKSVPPSVNKRVGTIRINIFTTRYSELQQVFMSAVRGFASLVNALLLDSHMPTCQG